ncbi:hypothetical protein [Micromonospora fluostatini]|uniref:hypothetical protein n=1 Tax=Micromonospora sp. JCM 30529 TaxID=3421643 RepID=UPI003D178FD4
MTAAWSARTTGAPVECIYVNLHHGLGRMVADAFEAEGFRVTWSGQVQDALLVHLN